MSVISEVSRVEYTGNGSATTFAYPFRILAKTDLRVLVSDILKTVDIDYTVTGVGEDQGNVVFTTAPASGAKIVIRRRRPLKQETDLTNAGRFFPEQVEDALDHLAMLAQQVEDAVSRSLKLQETEAPTMGVEIPKVADRALKFLAFDASGKPITANPASQPISPGEIFLTVTGTNGLRLKHDTTSPEKALVQAAGIPLYLDSGSLMTEIIGTGGTQVRIGTTTTNEGGYITSLSGSAVALSGGAQWQGGGWVARATSASIVECASGFVGLYANTGLTPGSSFSPSLRAVIGTSTLTSHLHFVPGSNNALDLGLSGQIWRTLYVGTVSAGTLTLTGSISFNPDNTIDLSPANARPRDVHVGRDLIYGSRLLAPDGSVTSPSLSFASETGLGFYRRTPNVLSFATGGQRRIELGPAVMLASDITLAWGNASDLNSATALDLNLSRDASGVLGLRAGTSPQALRIYNTYTDASNNEALEISWKETANACVIRARPRGTGASRPIIFARSVNEDYPISAIEIGGGGVSTVKIFKGFSNIGGATALTVEGGASVPTGVGEYIIFFPSFANTVAVNGIQRLLTLRPTLNLSGGGTGQLQLLRIDASVTSFTPTGLHGGLVISKAVNNIMPGIVLYNTEDETTNTERGLIRWSGTSFFIGTGATGTGAARPLVIGAGNLDGFVTFRAGTTDKYVMDLAVLRPATDNALDLGSSSFRWRNVYVAGSLITGDLVLKRKETNAHWVIEEFEDKIVAKNMVNGKTYRVALEEERV